LTSNHVRARSILDRRYARDVDAALALRDDPAGAERSAEGEHSLCVHAVSPRS
jgi:hypothetical protein